MYCTSYFILTAQRLDKLGEKQGKSRQDCSLSEWIVHRRRVDFWQGIFCHTVMVEQRVNSVVSEEAAHYELPHPNLCCLQIQLFSLLILPSGHMT